MIRYRYTLSLVKLSDGFSGGCSGVHSDQGGPVQHAHCIQLVQVHGAVWFCGVGSGLYRLLCRPYQTVHISGKTLRSIYISYNFVFI